MDWRAWLGLFTQDCAYAVYSLENVEAGLPIGYMIDDRRGRLEDRVKAITEIWAGTIEPYRTRHILQRVSAADMGDGLYKVRSHMIVSYTQSDGPAGLLASGYCDDIVRVAEDGVRLLSKVVYLDGTPARYLAYPL